MCRVGWIDDRRACNIGMIVFLMGLCALFCLPSCAGAATQREWFTSFTSKDGSTVVKETYHDTPLSLADIGFFDAAGKERAVIAGRHLPYLMRLSEDGYTGITGFIEGKEGYYLSMYSPFGRLLWEIPLPGEQPGDFVVTRKGRRTVVAVYSVDPKGERKDSLLMLDEKGAVVKRFRLRRGFVGWLGLTGKESMLVVITEFDVLSLSPQDLRELWCTPRMEAEQGGIAGVATSPDVARMAVLVAKGEEVEGQSKTSWRVIFFDAKSGKVLQRKVLPIDDKTRQPDPIFYDEKEQSFVVKTKQGRLKVNPDPSGAVR